MESDIRYTVDFLQRINRLRYREKLLNDYFREESYSPWALQQFFQFKQIEEFSKTKNFELYSDTRKFRYGILSRIFVLCFDTLVVLCTLPEVIRVRFLRVGIVTFSSDFLNADSHLNPRLRNIYAFLQDKNITYAEILHITNLRSFFKNLRRRKKFSIYLEAFTSIARLGAVFNHVWNAREIVSELDLHEFSPAERQFVQFLLEETIGRMEVSKMNIALYRRFFRFIGFTKYVSVDDYRYIPEILIACEAEHIATHVFQHSNFGYLTGAYLLPPQDYIFPTVFYTWNAYWEKRVKEISPYFAWYGERIQVGGRSYTPAQPPLVSRTMESGAKKILKILIPYEVSVRTEQIAPYIDLLLSDPRIQVLMVLRGTIDQISHEMQLNRYFTKEQQKSTQLVVVDPMKREEAIRSCDVIAGVYSGFLDESIETGVPVCVFLTDFVYVNRLDTDNLATLIDASKGNIYEQLLDAYHTPDALLNERRVRVREGAVDIRGTLQRIVYHTK